MPVDARAAERAEIHIAARHHGTHALGEEKRLRVERQIAVVHPEIPGKTGEAPEAPVIKLLSGKRLGGINAVAVVRAGEIALEPLRAELNAAHAAVMREQEIQIVVFKFDGVFLAAGEIQIERIARKRLHGAGGIPLVRFEIGEAHLGNAARSAYARS